MIRAIQMLVKAAMIVAIVLAVAYAQDIFRWLSDGASNETMVFHAVTSNDVDTFDRFATPETANARDLLGLTPLCYAAYEGDASWIRRLVRRGARVNDADREGRTPLMHAAMKNHVAACRALLEAGADADLRIESSGYTALRLARENSAWDCAELLMHSATTPPHRVP